MKKDLVGQTPGKQFSGDDYSIKVAISRIDASIESRNANPRKRANWLWYLGVRMPPPSITEFQPVVWD